MILRLLIFIFLITSCDSKENNYPISENKTQAVDKPKIEPTRNKKNYGLVGVSSLALRTKPDLKGNLIRYLSKGQMVTIIKVSSNIDEIEGVRDFWLYVGLIGNDYYQSEEINGWVFGGFVADYESENGKVSQLELNLLYSQILEKKLFGLKLLKELETKQIDYNFIIGKEFQNSLILGKCRSEGNQYVYNYKFHTNWTFDYKELYEIYEFGKTEITGKGSYFISENVIFLIFQDIDAYHYKINNAFDYEYSRTPYKKEKLGKLIKTLNYYKEIDLLLENENMENNSFYFQRVNNSILIGNGDNLIINTFCNEIDRLLSNWELLKLETYRFYHK